MLLRPLPWLRRQGQAIDQFKSKVAAALEPAELQPGPAQKARVDVPHAPTQLPGQSPDPKAILEINPDVFLRKMATLVEWRSGGFLTETEFVAAKRQLELY